MAAIAPKQTAAEQLAELQQRYDALAAKCAGVEAALVQMKDRYTQAHTSSTVNTRQMALLRTAQKSAHAGRMRVRVSTVSVGLILLSFGVLFGALRTTDILTVKPLLCAWGVALLGCGGGVTDRRGVDPQPARFHGTPRGCRLHRGEQHRHHPRVPEHEGPVDRDHPGLVWLRGPRLAVEEQPQATLDHGGGMVMSVDWAPDGRRFLSGGDDGKVNVSDPTLSWGPLEALGR